MMDEDMLNDALYHMGYEAQAVDDVSAEVVGDCGCIVEWDGKCEHGNESVVRAAGLI